MKPNVQRENVVEYLGYKMETSNDVFELKLVFEYCQHSLDELLKVGGLFFNSPKVLFYAFLCTEQVKAKLGDCHIKCPYKLLSTLLTIIVISL